jgi:hypothetical protein
LRAVSLGAWTLAAAFAIALLTVFVERVGPAPTQWRDELCSPFPLHPCDEGVLQGGWPLAYLLDKPGISVMAQLGLIEDRFEPTPFFLNVALFWAALLGASWVPPARRRRVAP